MLCEVINAAFLTYFGTEYLIISNKHDQRATSTLFLKRICKSNATKFLFSCVILVNICSRINFFHVTSFSLFRLLRSDISYSVLKSIFDLQRVFFAALVFFFSLFWDCRRRQPFLPVRKFLRILGSSFLRILPVVSWILLFHFFVIWN